MATAQVERVRELPVGKLDGASTADVEAKYKEIISRPPSVTSDAAIKEYETALISLGELYRDQRCVDHPFNASVLAVVRSCGLCGSSMDSNNLVGTRKSS